jgi:polysaccharide deacetylase 2 family uncharacterized protein YibQ
LALFGALGGYGVGYVFSPSAPIYPPVKPTELKVTGHKPEAWYKSQSMPPTMVTAPESPIFPENGSSPPNDTPEESLARAYEEGLPREIYIAPEPNLMKEELVLDAPEPFYSQKDTPVYPTVKNSEPTATKQENKIPGRIFEAGPKQASRQLPSWRRYALATPVSAGKPVIAIVIDDMGVDRRRSARMVGLQGPLTLSYLTYAKYLKEQATQARAGGHELMLHVSMEPSSVKVDPGPNVLLVGQKPDLILSRLRWGLNRLSGFVGINNHMGSKFTSHAASMKVVIGELKKRGLLFLDSRTSGKTVGAKLARIAGVPYVERNVFIDHDGDVEKIKLQLNIVERIARKRGRVVAIGHPRDATLKALESWLPMIVEKGFQLVPVSSLARVVRRKN